MSQMVRKSVNRPHAGNENGKGKKLSVKTNEGRGELSISAMQQHFHLTRGPGDISALLLNLRV